MEQLCLDCHPAVLEDAKGFHAVLLAGQDSPRSPPGRELNGIVGQRLPAVRAGEPHPVFVSRHRLARMHAKQPGSEDDGIAGVRHEYQLSIEYSTIGLLRGRRSLGRALLRGILLHRSTGFAGCQ